MKVALVPSASHTPQVPLSEDWLQLGVGDVRADFWVLQIFLISFNESLDLCSPVVSSVRISHFQHVLVLLLFTLLSLFPISLVSKLVLFTFHISN